MNKRISVLAILVMALLVTTAWSQGPGRGPQQRFLEGRPEFLKELNLTEQQKKEAEKIFFDSRKQAIAQRAAIATARLELQQLFRTASPDKAALEKKVKEMAELRTKESLARIDRHFAFRNILTPEQREKIRDRAGAALRDRPMRGMRQHMQGPGMRGELQQRMRERMERFRDYDPID